MMSGDGRGKPRGLQLLPWLLLLALLAAGVTTYFASSSFRSFLERGWSLLRRGNEQAMHEWIEGFGAWGPLIVISLMLLQTALPIIPSTLIIVVAVITFGSWGGAVTAWIGLIVAAALAYGFGRLIGPAALSAILGERTFTRIESTVDRYGIWAVVIARISPIISTDAVSFIAGLTSMHFIRFMLATGAGTLPLVILVAALGSDWGRRKTGLIWITVISVITFVGWIVYDHRRQRDRPSEGADQSTIEPMPRKSRTNAS